MHRAVGERVGQHVRQRGSANHHQRLTERVDQPVVGRTAQPGAVAPAQRPRGHPAAGIADRVAKADLVEGGQRVGPDADARTGRGVGALFDDGHVVAAALQRHRRREARNARPDHQDLPRHPSNVSAAASASYRSKINSVLVAVATTAPLASVTTPSAKPTREPDFTTVPVAVSTPLDSRTAFR